MQVGREAVEATTAALAGLLREPLKVVDVGCRWGFADHWHRLGDRCLAIGFDPDREECERLARHYAATGQVMLVPLALAAESGVATLYRTKNPGGYSLLPTVTDVVERHPSLDGGRLVGTSAVEVTTLDDWCAGEGIHRIDVIKLDTQGTELDVLRGAERALDTVRAVEVEVEFNQLYEGVPLFGEVDRFLRQRGFFLWRFRDMAHYAQAGAPLDWWSEELFFYDDHVARFSAGGGQLFWANAYFLRRPVAYPDASAGWEALVRDACITSALGFRDLVGLALARARDSAPPGVLETLDTALSSDGSSSRSVRAGSATTVLRGSFELGVDDHRFVGWGWQPVQQLDFGAVRWTGPAREAWVELPFRLPPEAEVEMLVVAAASTDILDGLVVEVNRVPVPLRRSPHEHGLVFRGSLPADYASPRPNSRLVVRTVDTVPWNELHPESWDDTELGVAVSWLHVNAP